LGYHRAVHLRNICAHYGRLYFRIFTAIPANLPDLEKKAERRLFGAIPALKTLYPDVNKWNNEIYERLKKLMTLYSSVTKLDHIGFPVDWEAKLRKEHSPSNTRST
jgi:abortive infection bacteriophage resistance protein